MVSSYIGHFCPKHPRELLISKVDDTNREELMCLLCVPDSPQKKLITINSIFDSLEKNFEALKNIFNMSDELDLKCFNCMANKDSAMSLVAKHMETQKEIIDKFFDEVQAHVSEYIKSKRNSCKQILDKELKDFEQKYLDFYQLYERLQLKQILKEYEPNYHNLVKQANSLNSHEEYSRFVNSQHQNWKLFEQYLDEENIQHAVEIDLLDKIQCFDHYQEYLPAIFAKASFNSNNIHSIIKEQLDTEIEKKLKPTNSVKRQFNRKFNPPSTITNKLYYVTKDYNCFFTGFRLLYQMSRDGKTAADFHKKCDQQGETLILIHTSEGIVLGALACTQWSPPYGNVNQKRQIEGAGSCLFLVDYEKKFNLKENESKNALHYDPSRGPCFGTNGMDLSLTSDFDLNENILSPGTSYDTSDNFEIKFSCKEIEIYKMEWCSK